MLAGISQLFSRSKIGRANQPHSLRRWSHWVYQLAIWVEAKEGAKVRIKCSCWLSGRTQQASRTQCELSWGTAVVQPMAQLFEAGLFVTLVNQVYAHAGIQKNSHDCKFHYKRPPGRLSPFREVRRTRAARSFSGSNSQPGLTAITSVDRGYSPRNRGGAVSP